MFTVGAGQKVLMVMKMMLCLLGNVGEERLCSLIESHSPVRRKSIHVSPEAVWCKGTVSMILSDNSAMSSRTNCKSEEPRSNMSAV